MNTLRRILSSWRNLALLSVALILFLVSPVIIRWYDPTAGAFDAGFLQAIVLAGVYTFAQGFFGWVFWQIAFASLDKLTASKAREWGNLEEWTRVLSPAQKVFLVQGTFIFSVILYSVNLWLLL